MQSTSQPDTRASALTEEFVPPYSEQSPEPGARKRSFTSLVIFTIITNLSIGFFGLLTGGLAARLLGPQGRGELAAIQTWATCIATFATFGLPEALVYFSSRSRRESGSYFASGALFIFAVSWVFVAAGLLGVPPLLGHHPAETIRGAQYYMFFVPIIALFAYALGAFRSASVIRWNIMRLLPVVGWLAVLAFAAIRGQHRPLTFALEYLAMLTVVGLVIAHQLTYVIPPPIRPSFKSVIFMLRFGAPSIMSSIPQVLTMRLDQMLIAALLPARALGLYVVAVAWSNIANPILSGLGTVLFPHIAGLSNADQQQRAYAAASRMAVLLSIFVAAALSLVTPIFLPVVFGRAFAEAIPTTFVLIAAATIAALNTVLEEGLRGLGKPKIIMVSEFAGVIVTAALLLLLLSRFGIMGAAVSCLCGYSTVCTFLLFNARNATGGRLRDLLQPGPAEFSRIITKALELRGSVWQRLHRP